MCNIEHEIECPNDKYIKHYLWRDYFHDSSIETIEFKNSKGKDRMIPDQVVLTLTSCVDMDKEWDSFWCL